MTDKAKEQTQVDPAAPFRSIKEIVANLSKPVAARHLSKKQVGKGQNTKTVYFISWHHAARYLDLYAPGWSYEVRSIQNVVGDIVLITRITIPCAEGFVYREATGREDEEKDTWGDPFSNAESMSFRRACAKFGLGLYLYDEDGYKLSLNPPNSVNQQKPPTTTPAQARTAKTERAENSQAAKTEPSAANFAATDTGPADTGEAASESQVATLVKLCESKKPQLDKLKIARYFSGDRTEFLEDLTATEAANAINAIPKMK